MILIYLELRQMQIVDSRHRFFLASAEHRKFEIVGRVSIWRKKLGDYLNI